MSLRDLRLKVGLSQAQLAERAGIRQATISSLENGRSQPHFATIKTLAEALDCKLKDIDLALKKTAELDANVEKDAIAQLSSDWPFLSGLDADLRRGLATSLVAEWTHSSTALEGNTITLGDTLFVLTEGLTVSGKSLREHQELHGHSQALALIVSWVRDRSPLGISQLHQLHRAVQTGVTIDALAPVGQWKLEANGTTAITSKGQAVWHDYADPRHVPLLIKEFLQVVNMKQKSISPFSLDNASLSAEVAKLISYYTTVHLGFVAIHPYADGNGRMARLLANAPLLKAGYPPLLVDVAERQRYLTLLGDYSLSRGQPKPGESLVFENAEFDAVERFFQSCWKRSLDFVREFHNNQKTRKG